jgi:hypothetical protein
MRAFAIILLNCLTLSCRKEAEIAAHRPEAFVGTARDLEEWPFRYTIEKEGETWRGEIEFVADGQSLPFDRMKIVESSDDHIVFGALFGAPGKALPCDWRMSLSPTTSGMEASLVALNIEDFAPVAISFTASQEERMPSEITPAWWAKEEAEQGAAPQSATRSESEPRPR